MELFVALIIWLVQFIVQLVGIALGVLIVPLMLLFGKFDKESEKPFTDYNTDRNWIREVFPRIFYPWDNLEDSSVGDQRGWWDLNCFGSDSRRFLNRFWWLAIRNPFNNFKRYILGCDVRKYTMKLLAGQPYVRDDFDSVGWQFIKAEPKEGKIPCYTFYGVWRYGSSNRALVIQLGNKVRLEHNHKVEIEEIDYFKGFTFEIALFKDIS